MAGSQVRSLSDRAPSPHRRTQAKNEEGRARWERVPGRLASFFGGAKVMEGTRSWRGLGWLGSAWALGAGGGGTFRKSEKKLFLFMICVDSLSPFTEHLDPAHFSA